MSGLRVRTSVPTKYVLRETTARPYPVFFANGKRSERRNVARYVMRSAPARHRWCVRGARAAGVNPAITQPRESKMILMRALVAAVFLGAIGNAVGQSATAPVGN